MSNTPQDLSPTIQATQKALADNKQITTVRKITVQSLAPIIAKLEEHITYLLDQTANLRAQNANLVTTSANQKALQSQVGTINQNLQKLTSRLNTFNRDKDTKLHQRQQQASNMREEIQKLKKEVESQNGMISQISRNNQEYLAQINNNKLQQLESVEQLRNSIERYYQQEIIRVDAVGEQAQELRQRVKTIEERRFRDQEDVQKISKIVTLYQYEREDIRKSMDKTSFLELNTVLTSDYQKDRKFMKISVDLLKTDIQTLLNQALTPQIRKFLPILINKLDDLYKFQKRILDITRSIDDNRDELIQKIQNLEQEWNSRFQERTQQTQTNFDNLKSIIRENVQTLQEKVKNTENKFNDRCSTIENESMQTKQQWSYKLNDSLLKLDNSTKIYINVWGDKFLQQKRQQIYSMVVQQKPKQEIAEQKRVAGLVYQMQPLLNKVKDELEQAHKQLKISKQILQEKLGLFSNQIVKMKTDLGRETQQNKRILQNYNNRLNQNQKLNMEISKIIAALTETTLILYSMSMDPTFLHNQHQVYVTYNDGILCQMIDTPGLLTYRRKLVHPQLLKRAVMTQMVSFIDSIIVQQPLVGWVKSQNKPSHFFNQIYAHYVALQNENADIVELKQGRSSSFQPKNRTNQSPTSQQMQRQSKQRNKNKFNSHNKDNFSRTIDFASYESKLTPATSRYEKEDQGYGNIRRNIRLKKIQKKQS